MCQATCPRAENAVHGPTRQPSLLPMLWCHSDSPRSRKKRGRSGDKVSYPAQLTPATSRFFCSCRGSAGL